MDAFKISVKFFATGGNFDASSFVGVFHGWIQNQLVADHLLNDVADYDHAAGGPGTVLVSSEANFYMDKQDGRLGLLYSRKLAAPGDFSQRLRAAVAEALKACARLEQEPNLPGLRFGTNEMLIRLSDRLRAPNTAETLAAAKPAIESLARELYAGGEVKLQHNANPEELFEVTVRSSAGPGIGALLERLAVTEASGVRS